MQMPGEAVGRHQRSRAAEIDCDPKEIMGRFGLHVAAGVQLDHPYLPYVRRLQSADGVMPISRAARLRLPLVRDMALPAGSTAASPRFNNGTTAAKVSGHPSPVFSVIPLT